RRAGGAAETTLNTCAFAARAWPDENHVARAIQLNERRRFHVVPQQNPYGQPSTRRITGQVASR
ncbi:MAG: hypothetical protein ACRDTT_03905, partial [Pseudonocardiaceae bacterium]